MERLDLSILNGNFTAIDKSALAVKEFAQNRDLTSKKSCVQNTTFCQEKSARGCQKTV